MKFSHGEIRAFQRRVRALYDQEQKAYQELRREYDVFVLNAGDDDAARRTVTQAYFHILKERDQEVSMNKLEFHPFFVDLPKRVTDQLAGDDDEGFDEEDE